MPLPRLYSPPPSHHRLHSQSIKATGRGARLGVLRWGKPPIHSHRAHSEKVDIQTTEGREAGPKEEPPEEQSCHQGRSRHFLPRRNPRGHRHRGRGLAGVASPSWPQMTWAMVMPPISESLKRRRKVPSGSLTRRLVTYCLLIKPMISLAREERTGLGTLGVEWELEAQLLRPAKTGTHRSDQ